MGKGDNVVLEDRDGVVGKKCTKCGEWQALSKFAKHSMGIGSKKSRCKTCESERKRVYYEQNKERVAETGRKWYEDNKERKSETGRKWSEQNKERVSEIQRRYHAAHKESRNETSRKWREDNPEYAQKYYEDNKDHYAEYARNWYDSNKERKAETGRIWNQVNRDRLLLRSQRRRARKAGLPDDFTFEQRSEALATFNNTCALTGDTNWTWDHAIPINSGHGGTIKENMYPLRGDLNSSKNDANIFEWFKRNQERFNLEDMKFNRLIVYLADLNDMTPEEYREYVYFCHENPNEIGGTGA
jgi:hypothetical protein